VALAALHAAGGPEAAVATILAQRPRLLDAWGDVGAPTAIGWFLLFALGTCAQPHYLQKFIVLRDHASLRWLPAVMTAALLATLTVWLGVGLGGTAMMVRGEIGIADPDSLAPAVLGRIALPWLGLVAITAVVSAVMSTAASLLNQVAAALTRDLPRAVGRAAPDGLLGARLATLGAAATGACFALLSERPVALLGVLGWGTFTAALLPTVVLGLNWRGAARRGAIAAMVVGPMVQLSIELGHGAGLIRGPWEPGLAGAALGTLALVLGSRLRPSSEPV
jgi:sodium/proline symporter